MRWTIQALRDYYDRQNPLLKDQAEIVSKIKSEDAREIDLHNQIMRYCDSQWPPWKYIRARPDEPSTISPGAQDFTIFTPHGVLCIECKRKNAKLSPQQLVWHHQMSALGHTVFVIRSFEEFLEVSKNKQNAPAPTQTDARNLTNP